MESRSPKELIENKIPYSEMTDEEIEALTEYKAALIVNSKEYEDRLDIQREYEDARIGYLRSEHIRMRNEMDELINKLTRRGGN